MANNFESSNFIIVNGVKMSMKEYNAMRRAKKNEEKKKKVAEKNTPYIKELPAFIKNCVKGNKQMKSLSAYYDNGYRQWGRIARDIIQRDEIRAPFLTFRIICRDIEKIIKEIESIGKKNDRDIFQYIEKLSYKIDDAKNAMTELSNGVSASGVCDLYKDSECIYGTGRRLGLKELMSRTWYSATLMDNTVKELMKISINGSDACDYKIKGSFSRF